MLNKSTPLVLLGNITDIQFNTLSGYNSDFDHSFKAMYKNPNSSHIRRKIFGMYNYTKGYLTQSASIPALEVNNLLRTIIFGFYSSNLDTFRNNFNSISANRLDELQMRCKDILKRMFGSDNVLLVFDNDKDKQPIRVYLDYIHDENDLRSDPLSFSWSNGFYRFNDSSNVMVSIFISIEYIRDLINHNYNEIKSTVENASETSDTQVENSENIIKLGDNFVLDMDSILTKFWNDFLCSFTIALYVERYRENIYSQIHTIIKIMDRERKLKFRSAYFTKPKEFYDSINKYLSDVKKTNLFKEFEKNNLPDELKPGLVESLSNVINELAIDKINPIDLYKILFDPLTAEVNTIKDKLHLTALSTLIETYTYSDSKIDDLNKGFGNITADLLASTIMLKRLIPLIIVSEFIVGDGEKYAAVKNIFEKMKKRITSMSFSTTNSAITKYIDKILNIMNNQIALITTQITFLTDAKRIKRMFVNLMYDKQIFIDNEVAEDAVNDTMLNPVEEDNTII